MNKVSTLKNNKIWPACMHILVKLLKREKFFIFFKNYLNKFYDKVKHIHIYTCTHFLNACIKYYTMVVHIDFHLMMMMLFI